MDNHPLRDLGEGAELRRHLLVRYRGRTGLQQGAWWLSEEWDRETDLRADVCVDVRAL